MRASVTRETKLLSRCASSRQLTIERAGLTCSLSGRVKWGEREFNIAKDLAGVLYRLMIAPGVATKEELADWLYGESLDGGPLSSRVRALMHRLRATLAHRGIPVVIKTRHAVGYELRPDLMPPAGTLLIPGAFKGPAERAPHADGLEAWA